MKKTTFIRLIDSYLQGSATLQERNIVEAYYQKLAEKGKTDLGAKREAALQQQMLQHILTEIETEQKPVVRLWPRIAVIAAAVIAMALCIYFFTAPKGDRHLEGSVATRDLLNDVAPGRSGATITLANGRKIALSDQKKGVVIGKTEITYDDETSLSPQGGSLPQGERGMDPTHLSPGGRDGRSPERGIMMAETKNGQTYTVTLPDGTKVWLNAASSIKFPASFSGLAKRVISLSGEAYFEVSKDKAHPFIVETTGQKIEVLGTHFNVNSYADEPDTKTTLLEGSVRVVNRSPSGRDGRSPERDRSIVLKPGQQAILDQNFEIRLKEVTDLEYTIAWRASGSNDPGSLIFDNDSLEEVMRRISRWYDVDIVYKREVKKDSRFSGVIRRDVTLSKVTELLENTGTVHFKIEGRRLVVMN
ncbi:MAG: FecR domain-containing protein [Bacteroidota bacterium]